MSIRGYPPFGVCLRALRMRYCYSRRRNYFVRISDLPGDKFRVEIVPPILKHLTHADGEFRVGGNIDDLIDISPALQNFSGITEPVELVLNEAGEVVKLEAP